MDKEDKFLHNLRKSEKSQHKAPSQHAWDRIHKKMEKKRSKRFFNRSLYWQGIAASFLLICFVSVIYYFFNKSLNKPGIAQSIPKEIESKPMLQDSKNNAIANNGAPVSQSKKSYSEPPAVKELKKDAIPSPKKIYSITNNNKAGEEHTDQSMSTAPIAYDAQVKPKEKSIVRPSPATTQSKMDAGKESKTAGINGFDLIPDNASGLWAGKMNNANYTASLKKTNNAWTLLGQHSNNKGSTQKIMIGEDDLSIQTNEGTKNYIYKNTQGHEARFETGSDSADYVLINYVNDKLEIFQSSGGIIKDSNKTIANQWKLVKSYE
ncbi:MAG TPA: hypothetical protein VK590_11205 [Saprospiraceae bacterium]|nr:hypothetical protein [Saprospiraceae bacterium]